MFSPYAGIAVAESLCNDIIVTLTQLRRLMMQAITHAGVSVDIRGYACQQHVCIL